MIEMHSFYTNLGFNPIRIRIYQISFVLKELTKSSKFESRCNKI